MDFLRKKNAVFNIHVSNLAGKFNKKSYIILTFGNVTLKGIQDQTTDSERSTPHIGVIKCHFRIKIVSCK